MITSPPFMSITPGPRAVESSSRSNLWNGLLGSKTVSRCPMSRSFGPGPGMLGHEMSRAVERRRRRPTRREAERVELAAQHVGDATHAGEVHRAAVDVDDALQQAPAFARSRVDCARDDALLGREGQLALRTALARTRARLAIGSDEGKGCRGME